MVLIVVIKSLSAQDAGAPLQSYCWGSPPFDLCVLSIYDYSNHSYNWGHLSNHPSENLVRLSLFGSVFISSIWLELLLHWLVMLQARLIFKNMFSLLTKVRFPSCMDPRSHLNIGYSLCLGLNYFLSSSRVPSILPHGYWNFSFRSGSSDTRPFAFQEIHP